MAVATVDLTSTYEASADPITIPLGTYANGNLLLLMYHLQANRTVSSGLSNWTFLGSEVNTRRMEAYARQADGTEGSSLSVNISGLSNNASYLVLEASGAADPAVTPPDYIDSSVGAGNTEITTGDLLVTNNGSRLYLYFGRGGGSSLPSTPDGWTYLGGTWYTWLYEKNDNVDAGQTGTLTLGGLNTGYQYFTALIAVPPSAAVAPTISSVTLTGTSQIGQTLTATVVTDQDPVDSTTYQWQKAATDDAEPGTDISGETSSTLALTYADFGDLLDTAAYVRCQAIATKNSLDSTEVASDWQAVTAPSGGGGASNLLKSPFIVG